MTQAAPDATTTPPDPVDTRSSGQLAIALSDQISRLVKSEIELAQAEVKSSVAKLGAGIGLFAAAGFLGFCLLICLLVAGGLGLAVEFSSWLAALIEAGVFLVLAAVLALLGLRAVKKAGSPVPQQAIAGLKSDLALLKQVKP
jgi:hypothetical protein